VALGVKLFSLTGSRQLSMLKTIPSVGEVHTPDIELATQRTGLLSLFSSLQR
jgi:hypothetical protein